MFTLVSVSRQQSSSVKMTHVKPKLKHRLGTAPGNWRDHHIPSRLGRKS